ncbi:MAG: DUF2071 domain-containing protein [Gemmatimonadales bacterium]
MPRPFITARWSELLLITFEAPEELVRRCLPPTLEPDRWARRTHVNLVALRFGEPRVRGLRIPWLPVFPQVNLRTFARLGDERGVWFIRELVPSGLVTLVSRLLYHQPYRRLAIRSQVMSTPDEITVQYAVGRRGGKLEATGSRAAVMPTPPPDSLEHYCKERYWGFGAGRDGQLTRFRVEHPVWAVREVRRFACDLDWAALFGPEWSFLSDLQPASVIYAVGSEVAIYPPVTT